MGNFIIMIMKDPDMVKILSELEKISNQLRAIETGEAGYMENFYRDSLEFMVEENIRAYKLMMEIGEERSGVPVHEPAVIEE